jgi:hypothetical protein
LLQTVKQFLVSEPAAHGGDRDRHPAISLERNDIAAGIHAVQQRNANAIATAVAAWARFSESRHGLC